MDEAYRTAWGIYNVTYVEKGYWFRTPEAWDHTGNFRAEIYMRPLAIWAMEFAKPNQTVTATAQTGPGVEVAPSPKRSRTVAPGN
jgi:Glycosyl-hydrolase family 116, catalytic region